MKKILALITTLLLLNSNSSLAAAAVNEQNQAEGDLINFYVPVGIMSDHYIPIRLPNSRNQNAGLVKEMLKDAIAQRYSKHADDIALVLNGRSLNDEESYDFSLETTQVVFMTPLRGVVHQAPEDEGSVASGPEEDSDDNSDSDYDAEMDKMLNMKKGK